MRSMRTGILLAQHITSAMHYWKPSLLGVPKCHWQSLMANKCPRQLIHASRKISWSSSQQQPPPQGITPPAMDVSSVAELRHRLQFRSDRELRQFWRRSGVRLAPERAANALHVLTTLEGEGVTCAAVKRHPAVLNIRQELLSEQLSSLRQLPAAVRDVFPLLLLRPDQLRWAVRALRDDGPDAFPGGARSRLHYLADQLQTSLETLCNAVRRNPFILVAPASRIIEITRLMIDGGIPRDAILDDPYIYRHNVEVMRERIDWVSRVGLRPLRPWMLRCAEHTLQEHVDRFQLRLEILSEHGDEVGYLSDRLGLGRAQVSDFQHRHPPALRASVMKLKAVLDVLLAHGVTGAQVAQQPRVLCYSARRLQERCERLAAAGLRPASLLVLCKTPRDFDRYMAAATGAATGVRASDGEAGRSLEDSHPTAAARDQTGCRR